MDRDASPRLQAIFRFIVARRWWSVALYALLFPVAIGQALRIETDNSIARLIVQSDPDFQDNQAFQRLFPEGEQVVLLAESADPFAPAALARTAEIEARLREVPRVQVFSALDLYHRAHPGGVETREEADEFRRF